MSVKKLLPLTLHESCACRVYLAITDVHSHLLFHETAFFKLCYRRASFERIQLPVEMIL